MNRSSATKWLKKLAVAVGAAALTTSSAFSALARSNPYYSFFTPGPGFYESSDEANLLERIASNNLTRFSMALQAAGMSNLLSQKDTFTVLAPTDEAFAMLPPGVWETLLKPENREILRKVVNYHLVPGKISKEILDSGKIFTLAGDAVTFQFVETTETAMLNEARAIEKQAIGATNGAIVKIDKVLLPPDVAAGLALGAISSSQPSPTADVSRPRAGTSRVTFECHVSPTANIPTTYAMTPQGARPMIRWTSDYFSGSGYTPEARCQEVAARFQSFYNSGTLKYLTAGYVNGQPAICVAQTQNSSCAGNTLLFTLKPGSDANDRLRKLSNLRSGNASGADVLYESSSDDSVYINFEEYLSNSTVENIGSANNFPSPTVPSAVEEPSAPLGGGVW